MEKLVVAQQVNKVPDVYADTIFIFVRKIPDTRPYLKPRDKTCQNKIMMEENLIVTQMMFGVSSMVQMVQEFM